MEILILSYFDIIEGPRIFLKAPMVATNDKVLEQIPSLLNLYHEGFFVNISADYKSANLIFELPSDYARGKYEILMISLVVDINSNINLNLSEDILKEFVSEIDHIEDAFTAFYIDTTKFFGDPEKLKEIEDTFQRFHKRSQSTFKALEEAEIRYRHLFENSPFSITIIDMKGIILDTNPANERLFGYRREDLVNKDFREYLTFEREKLPIFVQAFKDILKGEQTKPIETQITKRAGTLVWVLITYSLIKIGNKTLIMVITQEIDKNKKAEQQLKESEEKFRTIAEQSLLGIAIMQDNRIKYFNQTWTDIFGYTMDELKSWGPSEFIKAVHPDDKKFVMQQAIYKQMGSPIASSNYTFKAFKKSGELIWIENFGKTITFRGRPANLALIFDATEKRRSEQELVDSEEIFRKLTTAAKDGIIIMDDSNNIIFWNNTAQDVFGYAPDEIMNKNIFKTILTEKFHHLADLDNTKFKQTGKDLLIDKTFEVIGRRKNNTDIPLELSTSSVKIMDKWNSIVIIRDMTEKKKTENKLKESEEKYRFIAENANDLISIMNSKFEMEYFNEEIHEQILGYSKKDLSGESLLKYLHPDDVKNAAKDISKGVRKGEGVGEFRIRKKDGEYLWIQTKGKTTGPKINELKVLLIGRDITDRKVAEEKLKESEEKFRIIAEKSLVGITILQNDKTLYHNQYSIDLLGYKYEEMKSWKLKDYLDMIHPDDRESYFQQVRTQVLMNMQGISIQYRIIRKGGGIISVDNTSNVFNYKGKRAILSLTKDITFQKEAERLLKESEEKYRLITENANDLIIIINEKYNTEYVNEGACLKKLGYTYSEMLAIRPPALLHPEDVEEATEVLKKAASAGEGLLKARLKHKSGKYLWFQISGSRFESLEGNPKVLLVARDIHEQTLTEEKLKESEERSRRLIENISDTIIEADITGINNYFSPQLYDLTGYHPEEMVGFRLYKFIHPADFNAFVSRIQFQLNRGEIFSSELKLRHKDGHYIPVSFKGVSIKEEGKLRVIGVLRDITEQKIAEKEIKESEEKYRLITENANDMIGILNDKFETEFVNEQASLDILGYTYDELIGMKPAKFLHPDDISDALKALAKGMSNGEGVLELRLRHKNGHYIWSQIKGNTFYNKEGDLKAIMIARDITKQRQAEEELRESEEKYRIISENAHDLIAMLNEKFHIEYINNNSCLNIMGYSAEEVIGKDATDFVHPEDLYNAIGLLKEGIIEGRGSSDIRFIHKNKSIVWLQINGRSYIDKNGDLKGIIIARDITENKEAEIKLKESEEKYRALSETSPNSVIVQDFKGYIIDCNAKTKELLNKHRDQILGKSVIDVFNISESKISWLIEIFKKIRAGEINYPLTIEYFTSKGESRWVEAYSSLFRIGEKTFIQTILQDITVRKKTIQNLRDSELKYRHLFESTPYAIALIDMNGTFVEGNSNIEKIFGYETEEYIGKNFNQIRQFREEKGGIIVKSFKQLLKGEVPEPQELQIKRKEGTSRWVLMQASLVQGPEEMLIQVVVQDIHDRKMAEQKLRDSEEEHHLITDNLNDMICVINNRARFEYINEDVVKKLTGHSNELIGTSCLKVIHPDDIETALKGLQKGIKEGETKNTIRMFKKDGNIIWMEIHGKAFKDKDGTIKGLLIGRDISEKIKSEKLLRESEEKYRTLSEQSIMGIVIIQGDRIVYINRAIGVLFGLTNDLIFKLSVVEFFNKIYPEDQERALNQFQLLKEGDVDIAGYTYRLITETGEIRSFDTYAKSLQYQEKTSIMVTLVDVTEKIKAEQELKESDQKYQEAYKRANFYKDLIAHDMNNILNNVGSASQLCEIQPEKAEELRTIIKEQISRGAKLISNVQKISQIEQAEFSLTNVNVSIILKEAINFIKNSFPERDINIDFRSPSEEMIIHANELLLDAFENILINSVNYNDKTNIEIQIKVSKEVENKLYNYKIEFIDNGIGVSDERKDKIFQRGYSEEKSVKGMGFGLSLVKGIIERYNGKIWVEDKEKGDYTKGSNFIILIPEAV